MEWLDQCDTTPRPLRIADTVRDAVTAAHTKPPADDYQACHEACLAAGAAGEEISDGVARTIAGMYASDHIGGAFASTGAITGDVYHALFYIGHVSLYDDAPGCDRLMMDMMGTYLVAAGQRGPVPGWSGLWAR